MVVFYVFPLFDYGVSDCFLIKLIALLSSGTLGGLARANFVSDFVIFWACMDNDFVCMVRSLLCGVLSIGFLNIFILGS